MADLLFEIGKDGKVRPPLTLRPREKGWRGASGIVYQFPAEPSKAIKVYHDTERLKFEAKIRTMIKVDRPHVDRFDLAWPETIFVDASGQFRGFKMPFFGNDWVDLETLVQAKEAEKEFGIGDRHCLMIAANLALAVKALHDLRVYCIDLKSANVRVNLNNLFVAILDCDGMSVVDVIATNGPHFYTDKCTPEFCAPENMGLRPDSFAGKIHDRFALATIIFMLLNRGLHPYHGMMSFDEAGRGTVQSNIKNNPYPYGTEKARITPPKDSLYPFLPEEIKSLFDRAFSGPSARPSADEWFRHLNQLVLRSEACEKSAYHLKLPLVGCLTCKRDQSNLATQSADRAASSPRSITSLESVRITAQPTVPIGASDAHVPPPAAQASVRRKFSSTEITLFAALLIAVGIAYVIASSLFTAPMTTTAPATPRTPNITVLPTPPKPSLETVLRTSGLIGLWSFDCSRRPSEINHHVFYSVTQTDEGRAGVDNGITKSEFIIRSAEGLAQNKIELKVERSLQQGGHTLVVLMDGNRQRTWAERIENGQIFVSDGISRKTGQQTLWRTRCGPSPASASHKCTVGGTTWNCNPGWRCGPMPGNCQRFESTQIGR
jgi:serine/threonine protein kinase